MHLITVDIADYKVSADPDAVLITYALGSCIGVMVHDPIRKAAGLIHYMLPLSTTMPEKAKSRPAMFADLGIPLLFHAMYALGCEKQNLVVKVAGGGTLGADRAHADPGLGDTREAQYSKEVIDLRALRMIY